MIHALKIETEFFKKVASGEKTFEIRENDRHYQVGDYLALNEYNREESKYTGRQCLVRVDYILNDTRFLRENYVAMSISKCEVTHPTDLVVDARHTTSFTGRSVCKI